MCYRGASFVRVPVNHAQLPEDVVQACELTVLESLFPLGEELR